MAITTLDGWLAAPKQQLSLMRFGRTTVAATLFSLFGVSGTPGVGVLAGTSTTAGVVPTDATAGCPIINAFVGANKGYLGNVVYANSVASRCVLFDMLFKAGAYGFNANVTLSAQPSYASRVPGGTDFTNTEIWLECVTAFTGNLTYNITYTNQDGVTGRTTGTVATGVAPTIGRMLRMSLQAGDTGVQKIESVVATVSTAGTFNVLVLRRLATLRVGTNGLAQMDLFKLGMPEVFADSALVFAIAPDSTSTSLADVFLTIANG